ncbi:hypothetical protein M3689_01940 [Alkalihalophilus marmarensis]|uniref:Uncharacterized protein n=1 Tax=Alkalihalophilus marmarensis DSM 21297 TaxID=1188261 RepID=U6SM76_9BACI|nr:hypothetical protein [Alkalihalophilus marmarensis]ERN52713.1 hypothetical protein A33I_14895 [Alkalihalophilus marmarensis DSM 21297]MCM3488063.1 hypothetical protein [Alkalihalophilus marmarensis]
MDHLSIDKDFPEDNLLEQELEQDIIKTYKSLITSRYFTKSQIEQIVIQTQKSMETDHFLMQAEKMLIYIKGVFSLANSFQTYEEYDRRFSHYFTSLMSDILLLLKEDTEDLQEVDKVIQRILFYFVYDAELSKSPWPYLVQNLADLVPPRQLEAIESFLQETLHEAECARSTLVAYSYILLLVGKESKSLSLLRKEQHLSQQEVTPHFTCLKKRERFKTIQLWFNQLFPNRGDRGYGSLQGIADEMNASLHKSANEMSTVWRRWLLSPSFTRFQSLFVHVPEEDQETLLYELLAELKKSLHQTETTLTYLRILREYKMFNEAASYFLIFEHDPLRLHQEKKDLLKDIELSYPQLAKPIHHQFIVRLVEKKSRVHYEAAVSSIKLLQKIYERLEENEQFYHYIAKMRKQYRTYRAFVEELKKIE